MHVIDDLIGVGNLFSCFFSPICQFLEGTSLVPAPWEPILRHDKDC